MQLYSGPLSLFTAKVRIALREKGIAYERIDVPWSMTDGYAPKHPEVLRVHPKQQVPVLVDGALELYESTVILEYLDDAYPSPRLLPEDAAPRARCRQLEHESDELFFPHVRELIMAGFYPRARGESPDVQREADAQKSIAAHYHRLDDQLGDRTHLCDDFSVADIAQVLTVYFATRMGAPIPDGLPRLQAWQQRIAARSSVAAEFDGMQAALAGTTRS